MTDHTSTYLRIDGIDDPKNGQLSNDLRFVQEQHAIYDSCTNFFGLSNDPLSRGMRKEEESMQGREAKTTSQESTPLLSGQKPWQPSYFTASADSVYEPKKDKRHGVWLAMFVVFYVFYLVLGSVAFEGMEINSEIAEREDFREVRQRFLRKYSDVLGSNCWGT